MTDLKGKVVPKTNKPTKDKRGESKDAQTAILCWT